jgi:hypothetical protein
MVNEEVLSTGLVIDLSAFLASCTFPLDAFVLVEQVPHHVLANPEEREELLRFARFGDSVDVSMSTSGRVFHRDFELRWERQRRGAQGTEIIRVIYLGKAEVLPAQLLPGQKLDEWRSGLEPRARGYFLFGTLLGIQQLRDMSLPENQSSYAEVRIPRLLRYPVKAQRLQLTVSEYVEKSTGRVKLLRFEGLKSVEGRPA